MWLGILAGAGALAASVGGAATMGTRRFRAVSRRALERLTAPHPGTPGARSDGGDLPAPVARYFRAVISPDQPRIAIARLVQRGEFSTGDGDRGWQPFDATETFATSPPGFLWLARIRMAPGVTAEVRDGYQLGAGAMRASLCGLVTLADAHDTPEIAEAALQRWLAEAPWFPTALLPGSGVRWMPIDDTTARATIRDGDTTASIDFTFNESGEISAAFTPERWRATKGGFVRTPWRGTFGDYAQRDGVRIPLTAEVAWEIDGRRRPYWRGRITSAAYDTAGGYRTRSDLPLRRSSDRNASTSARIA